MAEENKNLDCLTPDGIPDPGVSEPTISDPIIPSISEIPRSRLVGKFNTIVDRAVTQQVATVNEEYATRRSRLNLSGMPTNEQGITPYEHLQDPGYIGKPWILYNNNVKDQFRKVSRCYWAYYSDLEEVISSPSDTLQYVSVGSENIFQTKTSVHVPYNIHELRETDSAGIDGAQNGFFAQYIKKYVLKVTPVSHHFRDAESNYQERFWTDYVDGKPTPEVSSIFTGLTFIDNINNGVKAERPLFGISLENRTSQNSSEMYFDHYYRSVSPLNSREQKKISAINNASIVNIKQEYNFFINSYENVIVDAANRNTTIESLLPNMYVMLAEKNNPNNRSEGVNVSVSDYHKHITLNGKIENIFKDINERGAKIGERDEGQYFEKWTQAYSTLDLDSVSIADLEEKFRRIIFDPSEISKLDEYNSKKRLFPMFVDIELSTDRTTLVAQALKDCQMSTAMIKFFTQRLAVGFSIEDLGPVGSYRFTTESQTSLAGQEDRLLTSARRNVSRQIMNFEEFVSFLDDEAYTGSLREHVIVSSDSKEIFGDNTSQQRFLRSLIKASFIQKIRNIAADKFRTYEEIMMGKEAYSETIFYRIRKYRYLTDGITIGASPVQDFFIPNSNDLDVLRFADTQVINGRKYRYEIDSYDIVFGSKYQYKNLRGQGVATRVEVVVSPSVQIVQTRLAESDVAIADKPPLPPLVDIIPYRGISDRILFNLNQETGELKSQPVVLDIDEIEQFESVREAQGLELSEPILFRGDDEVDFYEIYRISFRPSSYLDFEGQLRAIADSEFLHGGGRASSISYEDILLPNKKYYYTFRTVDIHGQISNPSAVYKVELLNDGSSIFPFIETYTFKNTMPPRKMKTFKRYLQIEPSAMQRTTSYDTEGNINSNIRPTLGNTAENLFAIKDDNAAKKIKIRVTSKHTGKKIDLNISFVHTHKD